MNSEVFERSLCGGDVSAMDASRGQDRERTEVLVCINDPENAAVGRWRSGRRKPQILRRGAKLPSPFSNPGDAGEEPDRRG